ncbi:tyrosine protein phosphatase yvh1 [Marasmius tenuissimus]|uniref:protein-tyrosine-phosphatase n=1 Tax=Marasmius tenuissimus TaxID=585030 RepID=A0ABR3A2C0_9AGAR
MDEIIPGLWIGNLPSALDVETLKANNIFSILSAMRGKVSIHETFIKHQILLDDTEEADILQHFLPSISFIQAEVSKGRGVLVHCQAGISRSVAIVAAYLMYDQNLTPEEALDLIQKSRPIADPNPGFLTQLHIFHSASYKISGRDKNTRLFYLERTVEEVLIKLDGDGSVPSTEMFAKFPQTPTASTPTTPGGHNKGPRRRIRCKMCRQELAAREHMLDHGQLGPATPASATPVASRRPSTNQRPSRNSITMTPAHTTSTAGPNQVQPLSRNSSLSKSPTDTRPRRSSQLARSPSIPTGDDEEKKQGDSTTSDGANGQKMSTERRPSGSAPLKPFANISRTMMDSLSMSALESSDEDEGEGGDDKTPIRRHGSNVDESIQLGRRASDAMRGPTPMLSPVAGEGSTSNGAVGTTEAASSVEDKTRAPPPKLDSPYFANPNELAAQLNANPKLAALRSPVSITPSGITPLAGSPAASPLVESPTSKVISPPIITNPKCSGYFVEPMKWMEPFLEEGQIAGKIVCPNKKCGVKLGNYDWAGVCCGCKEWVIPGFCINRSKVDEIVH